MLRYQNTSGIVLSPRLSETIHCTKNLDPKRNCPMNPRITQVLISVMKLIIIYLIMKFTLFLPSYRQEIYKSPEFPVIYTVFWFSKFPRVVVYNDFSNSRTFHCKQCRQKTMHAIIQPDPMNTFPPICLKGAPVSLMFSCETLFLTKLATMAERRLIQGSFLFCLQPHAISYK